VCIEIVGNLQNYVPGVVAQLDLVHMPGRKDGFGKFFPILKNRLYFRPNKIS
jgi:hypothetical protein